MDFQGATAGRLPRRKARPRATSGANPDSLMSQEPAGTESWMFSGPESGIEPGRIRIGCSLLFTFPNVLRLLVSDANDRKELLPFCYRFILFWTKIENKLNEPVLLQNSASAPDPLLGRLHPFGRRCQRRFSELYKSRRCQKFPGSIRHSCRKQLLGDRHLRRPATGFSDSPLDESRELGSRRIRFSTPPAMDDGKSLGAGNQRL